MRKRIILIGIVVILAAVAAYLYYLRLDTYHDEIVISAEIDSTTIDVKLEFGIPVDSFDIVKGRIKLNQNLSTLLGRNGIDYKVIDEIAQKADTVFDLRKIKSGHYYKLLFTKDTLHNAAYFIYQDSPIDYLIVKLKDSVEVNLIKKEVVEKLQIASGKIETSLWEAMVANGYNPNLANELSEIYAWSIDFFGLQKNDSFKVIYTESFVDTVSVGISNIVTASFFHVDSVYYAFSFEQDGELSYYDVEGNSLRKAFLKAPLKFNRISSRFSNSRYHPVLKIRRPHHGVDYAAPTGTPVYSIGDGRIIKKGYDKGGGNFIKIRHNGTYSTTYMHLRGFARGMYNGKYIKQGEVIGYVGTTGLSTGPHLDFRFYMNGKPIDPLKVKAPPVEPVKEENMHRFDSVKTDFLTRYFRE